MSDNIQSTESYLSEKGIHIIHNGKFYFSVDEGGRHPSWCNLKVLQGKHKTLVILSQPSEFVAGKRHFRRLFMGAATIATHITNLFGLDPATTIYLEYVPPTVPTFPEEINGHPYEEFIRYIHSPGDEKYERITFQWRESDAKEPVLEHYSVDGEPFWLIISPGEAAKLRMELEKE